MRRALLTLLLGLAPGCALYAPEVPDCSLACSDEGACPAGLRCDGRFCRPAAVEGSCDCRAQETRPCGSALGQCVRGIQSCSARGAWSACVGEVGPTLEVCDGLDNDCDGLVDKGPVARLADDLAGPWGLFGFDGGVGLVYGRATDGGTLDAVVAWFDPSWEPTGAPQVVATGAADFAWAASGAEVWLGWGDGEAVVVRGVSPDGGARQLGDVPGGRYGAQLRLGAGAQVVAAWLTVDPVHARLATWAPTGELERLVDLDLLDGGPVGDADAGTVATGPDAVRLSERGTWAFFQQRLLDAEGYSSRNPAAVEVASLAVRTVDVNYGELTLKLVEHPVTGDVGGITSDVFPSYYVSCSTDVFAGALGETGLEFTVSPTWEGLDVVPRPSGDLHVALADRANRRIILERVVGKGVDTLVTRLPLSPGDGYGVPRLAQTPGDEMLALGFAAKGVISARRLCGVPW